MHVFYEDNGMPCPYFFSWAVLATLDIAAAIYKLSFSRHERKEWP